MARLLPLICGVLLLSACAPSTPATRTADDQDLTRDLLWELRKDPRFADVRITCYDRTVTLAGTVSDRAAQDEALRLATQKAPVGTKIVNTLVLKRR
ncbi:MAG TPA: BON domain-containing protein [Planctomycetota bacterium]